MTSVSIRRWLAGASARPFLAAIALSAALPLLAMSAQAQTAASTAATTPRVLSLDDAFAAAERHSDQVLVAGAAQTRARGQLIQARAQLFPQLTSSLAYQRTIQSQFQSVVARNAPATDPNPSPDTAAANPLTKIFASPNTVIFGLNFSQNLFTGGRLTSAIAANQAGTRAADIGLTSARAQLRLDVAQSYYDAALSDRLVAIAESSLVQTERTFRLTALSRQVGNTAEFDLLRARVARDNQLPVVIQMRASRDVAYLRLRQLLNLPLNEPVRLTTLLGDDAPAPPASRSSADAGRAPNGTPLVAVARPVNEPIDVDALLAESAAPRAALTDVLATADTAVDNRAAVRQARENLTAQRSLVKVARGQRLPALQLTSNYQRFAYPDNRLPGWNDFFPNWTVSLGLSLPILTGGRIRGDELVAQANLNEATARFGQARDGAALDARVAVAQLEQAMAAYAASAGTSEQAGRAYTIAEVRYREGISTQVELNDSRLLLQQAQANRAQTARDLQVARLKLSLLRDLPLNGGQTGASGSATGAAQGGASQGAGQQQRQSSPQGQSAGGFTQSSSTGVTP